MFNMKEEYNQESLFSKLDSYPCLFKSGSKVLGDACAIS